MDSSGPCASACGTPRSSPSAWSTGTAARSDAASAGGRGVTGVSVAIGGLELRAEVLDEAHARLASVGTSRGAGHARRELKAPMPGLLVRLLCATGDTVEAGQPLAVLQAMKMENELSLPRG